MAINPKLIECSRFSACGNKAPMYDMYMIDEKFVCYDCWMYWKQIKKAFLDGDHIEMHKP